MRTRDERAKRERQIDRTSGRLERNRRERRTREAAIYASQKSPTKRARPLQANEELRRREDREKTKKMKGGKIQLTAYHMTRAKSIGRNFMLIRIRYKIDIKHTRA